MLKDLVGISLILIVAGLGFIAYFLTLAGWNVADRRFWPPRRIPTEWKLAGAFFTMAILKLGLGILVFGTPAGLPGWFIIVCLAMLFFVGLLFDDFARPPQRPITPKDSSNGS